MSRVEITSHLVMSCVNYSGGDCDRAALEYFLPQEHLILTHELQNVWDCCGHTVLQNCSCGGVFGLFFFCLFVFGFFWFVFLEETL